MPANWGLYFSPLLLIYVSIFLLINFYLPTGQSETSVFVSTIDQNINSALTMMQLQYVSTTLG